MPSDEERFSQYIGKGSKVIFEPQEEKEIIDRLLELRKEKEKLMTLNEYQDQQNKTAIFKNTDLYKIHPNWGIAYCVMQLNAEAGEIASKYAKQIRKGALPQSVDKEAIKLELGDCLWYISALANELGFTLEDIAKANIEKLQDRANRGVLHGSGDNR